VVVLNELSEDCFPIHNENDRLGEDRPCGNEYCSRNAVKRITCSMDQAAYSIDIAMYNLNMRSIRNAILRAQTRGVKVRLITERFAATCDVVHELGQCGVPVRGPQTNQLGLMHHKFVAVDAPFRVKQLQKGSSILRRPKVSLITGSANWTNSTFGGNWETFTIWRSDFMANYYQEEFNRLWKAFELRPQGY
ncbi:hypothetical protein KR018_011974, partial [Drosophila ironensis]